MNTPQGFSLSEVLAALFLITSVSLSLITQQWRVSQLLNQLFSQLQQVVENTNKNELSNN